MNKPPPPPFLPSAQERKEAFNNWLNQFWNWSGSLQLSGTSPILVGTGTNAFSLSHGTSGATAGTYGGTGVSLQIAVNAQGHVTFIGTAT